MTEDELDEVVITLDENSYQSFEIFEAIQTQWRTTAGMDGQPYALDYAVLPVLFDVYNVKDRRATLTDLRIMEKVAVLVMRETRSQ